MVETLNSNNYFGNDISFIKSTLEHIGFTKKYRTNIKHYGMDR